MQRQKECRRPITTKIGTQRLAQQKTENGNPRVHLQKVVTKIGHSGHGIGQRLINPVDKRHSIGRFEVSAPPREKPGSTAVAAARESGSRSLRLRWPRKWVAFRGWTGVWAAFERLIDCVVEKIARPSRQSGFGLFGCLNAGILNLALVSACASLLGLCLDFLRGLTRFVVYDEEMQTVFVITHLGIQLLPWRCFSDSRNAHPAFFEDCE